jgi:hypothetical protein
MVAFPSLVKGDRLKIYCVTLRGFKSPCYHSPIVKDIARLAQLVERQTFNLVVVGSSPTVGTKSNCLKQLFPL